MPRAYTLREKVEMWWLNMPLKDMIALIGEDKTTEEFTIEEVIDLYITTYPKTFDTKYRKYMRKDTNYP